MVAWANCRQPNRKMQMFQAGFLRVPLQSWLQTAGREMARNRGHAGNQAVDPGRLAKTPPMTSLQTGWPFNTELAQATPKRFRIEA